MGMVSEIFQEGLSVYVGPKCVTCFSRSSFTLAFYQNSKILIIYSSFQQKTFRQDDCERSQKYFTEVWVCMRVQSVSHAYLGVIPLWHVKNEVKYNRFWLISLLHIENM